MSNFTAKMHSAIRGTKRSVLWFFVSCVVAVLVSVTLTHAAFNKQLNYQGKLTNASNVAVADGTYNMEFKLYTVSSGGVAIWTETRTGTDKVQVTSGLFSVMLGEVNPLTGVNFNQTLYLGVNIGGTGTPSWDGEMTPRKKLGAVPAAVEAENLGGASASQYLRSDIAATSSVTDNTNAAFTVAQLGTGNIFDVLDGATKVLTVLDGGNVGIGDATPAALFTVGNGDLFQVNSSGAIAAATGITTSGALTLSTTPTTSAGTYDILTRNTSTGAIEKIASNSFLTANQTITLSGDVSGSGTTAITTTIGNNAVTFGKFQTIGTGKLLGRSTTGTGNVEELSIGSGLSLAGGTLSATGAIDATGNYDWTGTNTFANANGLAFKPFGTSAGETTETRFLELAANGTEYAGFKAPDSLVASVVWTLPTSDSSGCVQSDGSGHLLIASCLAGGGGGTVTSFSAGDLSPLFTTSVSTPTTTPALGFTLSNAAANTWFGNNTGSSAAPAYNAAGTLSKTDDTNVTLTLGGTPAGSLLNSVSITAGWTGQLAVGRGGTGAGTLTANGVLYGNGTSAIGATAAGTNGQILVGVTGGAPAFVSLSGDAAITNTGVLTIGANAVTYAKFQQVAASSIVGNPTGSLANAQGITLGAGLAFSGTSLVTSSIPNSSLQNSSITLATGTTGTDVGWGASSVALGGTATLNIPDAGSSARGVVTTGAQTFAGVKTLSSAPIFSSVTDAAGNFLTLNTSTGVVQKRTAAEVLSDIGALSSSTSSTQTGYFGDIKLQDDTTPSNYLSITDAENLTADHILSLNVNNADRTVSLSGNLTVSSAATISGTNTGDVSLAGQNYLSIAGQVITANAVDLSGTNATGTLAAARLGAFTGDVTSAGASYATTIASNAVTYAKFQQVAANSIVGNPTGALANAQAITLGATLTFSGTALQTVAHTGEVTSSANSFALTIDKTITPTWTGLHTFNANSLGTTQSATKGIALTNTTAAAAGAQQISPAIVWTGQGWKTSATAASQSVQFRADVLPVQGGAAPTGTWQLAQSINGGAYSNVLTVTSAGAVTATGAITGSNLSGTNTGDVTLAGQNYLSIAGQVITANAVNLSGTNVTGTLAAARFGSLTGDVTSAGGTYATTIANNAVTYGKFQQVAASSIVGNPTGSLANAQGITLGAGLAFSGTSLVTSSIPNSSLQNSTIALVLGTSGTDANVSGSPASLGGTLTLNIPDASATARGLVTTGSQTLAGIKTFSTSIVVGSIPFINNGTGSLSLGAATPAVTGSFFAGTLAGNNADYANNSVFIGNDAGDGAIYGAESVYIGHGAGAGVTYNAYNTYVGKDAGSSAYGDSGLFLGVGAGSGSGANYGIILGYNAGTNSSGDYQTIIGYGAGAGAYNAASANFIGATAGVNAANANDSNFIGSSAGNGAANAAYSNLIGYHAGMAFVGNNIGSNNIVIGTNISLPDATTDSINIGGILFGSGTYSTTSGDPSIGAISTGKIGIGVVTPSYRLDVLDGNTGQVANNRVFNVSNNGADFDTTAGALLSYGGYFSSTATRSAGANALTNIGLYTEASGAQNNYGLIVGSGSVGIGTSTPIDPLQVNGAFRISGSASARTALASSVTYDYVSSGSYARIESWGGNSSTRGGLVFRQSASDGTLGQEPFSIDSAGKTTLGTGTTATQLVVNGGNASSTAGQLLLTNGSGQALYTGVGNGGGFMYIVNQDLTYWANGLGNINLTASGGSINLTGNLLPATTDTVALGSTSKMFSDLFLASGAVENFNNGDVTLTHSADTLTLAGGTFVTPTLTVSGLTSGRVPYVTTGGQLTDTGALTWNNSTNQLSLSNGATGANEFIYMGTSTTSGLSIQSADINTNAFLVLGDTSSGGTISFGGTASVDFLPTITLKPNNATFPYGMMLVQTADTGTVPAYNIDARQATAALSVQPLFGIQSYGGTAAFQVNADSTTWFNAAILPRTSDGAALGSTSKMWSDLFLASGSVVNWNAGDVTLTHSADMLTLSGGSFSNGGGFVAKGTGTFTGEGVSVQYLSGTGYVDAYDFTNSLFKPLKIRGSNITFNDGTADYLTASATAVTVASLKTGVTAPTTTGTTRMVITDGNGQLSFASAPVPTGTNTGDVTLAAVGSSPNANGASLSGQVLNLQPADGSNPGVITAGAQTIGGNKTFNGQIGIGTTPTDLLTVDTGASNHAVIGDIGLAGSGGKLSIGSGGMTYASSSYSSLLDVTDSGTVTLGDSAINLNGTLVQVSDMLGNVSLNAVNGFLFTGGNMSVSALDTDNTAPTTTGTTKMVITDANGQLSFTNIPAGGSTTLNSILAATGTNTINNAAYAQEWQWNSLTTGTGMKLSSTSVSSGTLLDLTINSTAAASDSQKALNISTSGTNATTGMTTYGAYVSNAHAGTSSTNVAMYLSATGGTANRALIIPSGGGRVGIGTTSPTYLMDVVENSTGFAPAINIANSDTSTASYAQVAFTGSGRTFGVGVGNSTETVNSLANKFFIYDSTSNAVRFVVDTGGSVGIGDATPNSLFTVGFNDAFQINSSGQVTNGSITSTFGAIDVGADNITSTGTVYGNTLDRSTAGILSVGSTATSVAICASTACDTINIGTNADADSIVLGDTSYLDTTTLNGKLDAKFGLTAQTASMKVGSFTNSGATFNTTSAAIAQYTGYFANTATRSTGSNALTNIGLYASASGAQNNYAAIFDQGYVGIGTTTPSYPFEIYSSTNTADILRVADSGAINTNANTYGVTIYGKNTYLSANYPILAVGDTSQATAYGIALEAKNGVYNIPTIQLGFSGSGGALDMWNYRSWQPDSTYGMKFTTKASGNAATDRISIGGNADTIDVLFKNSNVGIGATAASSKLDITTNSLGTTQTTSSGLALVNTTAAGSGAQQISPAIRWTGQGWKTDATAASQAVDFRSYLVPVQGTANPSGYLTFESAANGGAFSNRFTIDSSGKIGIGGITAPTNTLSVNGTGYVNGWFGIAATSQYNSSDFTIGDATDQDLWMAFRGKKADNSEIRLVMGTQGNVGVGNDNAFIGTATGDKLEFRTNNSGRLTILGGGNVGIANGNPSYALHVGTSSISGIVARFENSTGTCDINPTTTSLSCSSDMRLKKNITTLDSEDEPFVLNTDIQTQEDTILAKVLALTPVTYNWNSEDDSDPKHVGFIAQEVEQVFPDLVSTDDQGRKSLNYIGLVPYTIKAVQEMNIRVAALPEFEDQTMAQKVADFLRGIAERGEAVISSIKAQRVHTEELCVGSEGDEVCVTKDQLQNLLNNTSASAGGSPTAPEPTPTPDQGTDTGTTGDTTATDSTGATDSGTTDTSTTDTPTNDTGTTDTTSTDTGSTPASDTGSSSDTPSI